MAVHMQARGVWKGQPSASPSILPREHARAIYQSLAPVARAIGGFLGYRLPLLNDQRNWLYDVPVRHSRRWARACMCVFPEHKGKLRFGALRRSRIEIAKDHVPIANYCWRSPFASRAKAYMISS
jgi:hypothetical protein